MCSLRTTQDVQAFQLYRKFVHKFAEIAQPPTDSDSDILKSMEFEEKFGRAFSKKAPVL